MSFDNEYRAMCQWAEGSGGDVPDTAVPGGTDSGEVTYIGRAVQSGGLVPGKVVPSHGKCYVPYNGREHGHSSYQYLRNSGGADFIWMADSKGRVPVGAVQGGITAGGEVFYIGRTRHNSDICVGKIHPSDGFLYIPYDGKEHHYTHYEVLVARSVKFGVVGRN